MSLKAFVIFVGSALLTVSSVTAEAQEMLTNEDILKMVKAGLPSDAIVTKIKTTPSKFEINTNNVIDLHKWGIPGPVLVAMIDSNPLSAEILSSNSLDTNIPHYPGIYIYGEIDRALTRLIAATASKVTAGKSFGYLFTGGIISSSIKASIAGKSAKVLSVSNQPVFFIFFDESIPRRLAVGSASVWQSSGGLITTSPNELTLVRFNQKKGAREARVGSNSIAGSNQGVKDKDNIPFEIEEIRPGVFKVRPNKPLLAGEYGFLQITAGNIINGKGTPSLRVYDFSISE